MKTRLALLIVSALLTSFVAQAQMAKRDTKFINLGLGFGTNLYSGSYFKLQVPPISASFEYIILDDLIDGFASIGVGGYFGYRTFKNDYSQWGWKYTNLIIGPRGYFHYSFLDELDTYTGVMLGYSLLNSTSYGNIAGSDYHAPNGGLAYAWFLGARYFFTDNLAVMGEIGYGVTYFNIGISLAL